MEEKKFWVAVGFSNAQVPLVAIRMGLVASSVYFPWWSLPKVPHTTDCVQVLAAMYSASHDDSAWLFCRFDRHSIWVLPSSTA